MTFAAASTTTTAKKRDHQVFMGSNSTAFTAYWATVEEAVAGAYSMARQGRRQAVQASGRLETMIYQSPPNRQRLALGALSWLGGCDLTVTTGIPSRSDVQTIIRRLNDALDGNGLRVTETLLEPSEVERLRLFRQQVRTLLAQTTAPPTTAGTMAGDFHDRNEQELQRWPIENA